MAGTSQQHPRPWSVRELAAIRAAMLNVLDETDWTQKAITQSVGNFRERASFARVSPSEFKFCQFAMDASTISRWKHKQTNISQAHAWAICLWLRETYPDKINESLRRASLDRDEPLPFMFSEMSGATIDLQGLDTMRGEYQLYRPCFVHPDKQFLASLLRIGSDKSDFDCTMETKHPDQFRSKTNEIIRGKIVPATRSAICFMAAPKSASTFIINFHKIERVNDDHGEVTYMIGVLLASPGDFPSTAWPVFARRLKPTEKLAAKILPARQFARLDVKIREALSRGIVFSEQRFFPGLPFSDEG